MKKRTFSKAQNLAILKEASEQRLKATYYSWKQKLSDMGEAGLVHGAGFLSIVKTGYVPIQAERMGKAGELEQYIWSDNRIQSIVRFYNGLIISGSHRGGLFNHIEYQQLDKRNGKVRYSSYWITNIPIDASNIEELVRVARARWKIEKETFNTLKNQGYKLEHNYGYGKQYLTANFATLMFLAFLVNQVVQALSPHFPHKKAQNFYFYLTLSGLYDF